MGGVPAADKFESVVSTTVPAKSVEEHLATVLHHHRPHASGGSRRRRALREPGAAPRNPTAGRCGTYSQGDGVCAAMA